MQIGQLKVLASVSKKQSISQGHTGWAGKQIVKLGWAIPYILELFTLGREWKGKAVAVNKSNQKTKKEGKPRENEMWEGGRCM